MIPLRDVIPSRTRPGVTITLIVLNVLVFLLQSSLSESGQQAFVYTFGVVPAYFSFVSVLTSMFVHGGLAHIAGNMLFLWIFGDNVEDFYGHFTYLFFYLLCGIGSGLLHVLFNMSSAVPALGASGAISGVMGAYLILYPRSQILTLVFIFLVPIPAVIILGLWFVMQFLSAFGSLGSVTSGGVAWWAHVGGFLLGMFITMVSRSGRSARWQTT